jgi:hypothetical protein
VAPAGGGRGGGGVGGGEGGGVAVRSGGAHGLRREGFLRRWGARARRRRVGAVALEGGRRVDLGVELPAVGHRGGVGDARGGTVGSPDAGSSEGARGFFYVFSGAARCRIGLEWTPSDLATTTGWFTWGHSRSNAVT